MNWRNHREDLKEDQYKLRRLPVYGGTNLTRTQPLISLCKFYLQMSSMKKDLWKSKSDETCKEAIDISKGTEGKEKGKLEKDILWRKSCKCKGHLERVIVPLGELKVITMMSFI